MLPYWLLFSVFAAGALQYGRQPTREIQAAPLLAAGGLFVVILIGLRFNTGADWNTYIELFDNFRYLGVGQILTMGDPGYGLVNWAAQTAGLGIWSVNLVCAAIFGFGLITFVRHQPNPWLAVCVAVPYLIIVVAMGYTRQAVAIGLIMAALTAWEKQSLARFAFYMLLAASFHKTAVVVIPLVALTGERHRFVIGAFMSVMAFLLYSWFLEASLDRLVTNYIEQEYFTSQGAAIRVGMNLVPATIFLLLEKRFGLSESQRKLWRNFSFTAFALLAVLIALPSNTAVDRVALYILPLQLFVLSRLPDAFPVRDGGRNPQLVLLVIVYSAVIQFTWLNYAAHAAYWLPYHFYPTAEATTYEESRE